LLKDVLDAWKKEVEKKPAVMSVDDAYGVLGLHRGVRNEEATIRKAYYRLAQQFHPDKNPEGRVSWDCRKFSTGCEVIQSLLTNQRKEMYALYKGGAVTSSFCIIYTNLIEWTHDGEVLPVCMFCVWKC
jgi:preprotein translocase subunit Sec63